MTDETSDWIPETPGEDPAVTDVEPELELGGVDRGDDVAQDLQENLEDGALSTDPVPPTRA